MTHSEIDTGSRPAWPARSRRGHDGWVSRPALKDHGALSTDLVDGAAKICDGLVLLLLFDLAAGGMRATRVYHPDERRRVVLQARLSTELRAIAQPGGPVLPADAGALPEPVRAVITEELQWLRAAHGEPDDPAQQVLVVPVCGSLEPIGVLVLACPDDAGFSPATVDEVLELGEDFGHQLELARLAGDAQRGSSLMEALPDAVIAVDDRDVVTQWNAAAEHLYRIGAAEAIGARLNDLVRNVFRDADAHSVHARVHSDGSWIGRVRQTSRSGPVVECDVRMVPLAGIGGRVRGRLGIYRQVAAPRRKPAASSREPAASSREPAASSREPATDTPPAKRRARSGRAAAPHPVVTPGSMSAGLLDALDSPAALLDSGGRVAAANARWQLAVTDAPRSGCWPVPPGVSWTAALKGSVTGESRLLGAQVERLLASGTGVVRAECRCDTSDHNPTVVSVVPADGITAIDGRAGSGALVVLQPPRAGLKPIPDELTHRATHDELTGLPNRAKLMDDLSSSLNRLDGTGKLAVLFCDLDGFKDINDGLGHDVGDQVLIAVAKRLRQRCRSADVVARFGGDEFVVVLSITDAAQAIAMADRIVEVLAEPIVVGEAEVAPGVSVGITVVDVPPDDDNPVGTLLRDADTAMYHAKGRGRGRYELFDASLRENIEERLELAAALHHAVADDQLEIVYQSTRHCGDRRVAGVEAMLRWRHPTLGLLDPDVFIPIAERTGRIVELGEWVLHRALTDIAALDDPAVTLAVNVSPRQLAGGRLARAVAESLAATGVDPSRLTLEITESAFVDDPEVARAVLTDLRHLGISIALDDFGTGWSSLQYLRTLPVDVLKIDRSFVADLPTDLDACAVVAAVLQLGHGMGLVVVAEGVENDDQLSVLRDMGCDEYQGFIDGRPGSLSAVLGPSH